MQPRGDVANADRHVGSQSGLGDLPAGDREVQQLGRVDRHVVALAVFLVGMLAQRLVEDVHRDRHQVGVGNPRAIEAVGRLALLVLGDLGQRVRRHLRLAPIGDERGHAAHRMRAAAVARLHQQLRVGAHERHGHRHLRAIGQHQRGTCRERLDDAEDVVPAAGVESRGMLAQLVQDLVHLERGPDRLDQHGGADRAARHADHVLRPHEHVVPQPRFEVGLHLGQVEVGPRSARQRLCAVVEQVQPEVEQRAGHRRAVDLEVALDEVPAARPDDERRQRVAEAVFLALGRGERQRPTHRVLQCGLAADHVRPGWRKGILEVGHEDLGARVERVDRHLGLGRAGDLDASVVQVRRRRCDRPFRVADRRRLGQEVQRLAGGHARRPVATGREDLLAARLELAVKTAQEFESVGCQDALDARNGLSSDAHSAGHVADLRLPSRRGRGRPTVWLPRARTRQGHV